MAAATVLFLNLTGACFAFGRRFFLKDTGRKLAHFERELERWTRAHAAPSAWRGADLMSRYDRDENPDEIYDSSVRRPPEPSSGSGISNARGQCGGSGTSQDKPLRHETRPSKVRSAPQGRRTKHPDLDRDRTYALRDSELKTLTDIGTFRVLKLDDLVAHRYEGDPAEARRDLDNLLRQGLILRRTTHPEKTVYVTLTKAAHRFLEGIRPQDSKQRQALYHGFVKPRDARHDAAIYRLYQQESARIEKAGGKVQRVILDFELKRSVNHNLAKLQSLPAPEQAERKREIAEENSLPIVNGKVALPDLRLEYEGPDQELGKVDLELITGDYHAQGLKAKAQTGFAMYALPEDAARLRPAMSDPEIMLDILSL